jgi:hypothetical protein
MPLLMVPDQWLKLGVAQQRLQIEILSYIWGGSFYVRTTVDLRQEECTTIIIILRICLIPFDYSQQPRFISTGAEVSSHPAGPETLDAY